MGGGAGGKVGMQMYARWMAKISALYQLPYGFDISGTINAREGCIHMGVHFYNSREEINRVLAVLDEHIAPRS